MISDELTVSTLPHILHRYLKKSGFDAIVFYDPIRMLHFYDVQSSFYFRFGRMPSAHEKTLILNNEFPRQEAEHDNQRETREQESVLRKGKERFKNKKRQENPTISVSDAQSAREMNTRGMDYAQVWYLLRERLRQTTVRIAFVLNDMQLIQFNSVGDKRDKGDLLQALTTLSDNRAENKNVVIFCTNASRGTSIQSCLIPPQADPSWANFAELHLVPLIQEDGQDDQTISHLIRIGTPNASEIRNMLLMLSIKESRRIEMSQLSSICSRLAMYARQNSVSMVDLLNKVRETTADKLFDTEATVKVCGGKKYKTVREQLDELVGMDSLRKYFDELTDQMNYTTDRDNPFSVSANRLIRPRYAQAVRGHALNIMLLGDPGTGKSRAASLIAGMYGELGLLPVGHTVSVSATELDTAEELHAAVRRAIGGALVIDEAYALMNQYGGQNVIDALIADMGTYAGQFAVVFAGYEEQTRRLMESNEGLNRRIGREIVLENYTWEQIEQIFFVMAENDDSVDASRLLLPKNRKKTDHIFKGWVQEAGPHWGNAGEAEKLLSEMKRLCGVRLSNSYMPDHNNEKLLLDIEDFPESMQIWASDQEQSLKDAYAKLDEFVGLDNIKKAVYRIARSIQMNQNKEKSIEPGFYVFQGPPGTGKTMIAETMGFIFQKLGVIGRRKPVVYTARQIMQPPKRTKPGQLEIPIGNSLEQALAESENAILFIDEAHQLADSHEGFDVLRALVPRMENAEFRQKHCIILAGYTTEMAKLFEGKDADSGLSSRFPLRNRLNFKNYTASELRKILEIHLAKAKEKADPEFLYRSEVAFSKYLISPPPNFGNGRFIRNEYIPNAQAARDSRLAFQAGAARDSDILTKEQIDSIGEEDRHRLTKYDIPNKPTDFRKLAGPIDAIPEKPVTAETLSRQLFGKEEILTFIASLTNKENYLGGINYTICGPLGCGKETAIRTIAAILAEYEYTESREVYIFGKGDLEAGYVGQTAEKTRSAITNAQGATVVLNAPSTMLLRNNSADNSFGPEAIGEFMNCIQMFGENTCFVIMDSEDGMKQFMKAYPQIRSIFEKQFILEDLDIDTMQKLFALKTEDALAFDEEIQPLMKDMVANWVADRGGLGNQFLSWSNGDEIEKLIYQLKTRWETAEGEKCTDRNQRNIEIPVITKKMFPPHMQKYIKPAYELKENILQEMDHEIGLDGVKEAIKAIEVKMRRGKDNDNTMPGNYCFVGNPGTGKTRMAKKLGAVLQATGVLKQGMVITRTAREMCQQRAEFDKIVRMARENILFIDEAHQLADTYEGIDVIKRLLTVLEDVEVTKHTCFVLAGYESEMMAMLSRDAGLKSRFGMKDSIIRFDDYTEDELIKILIHFGRKAKEEPQIGASRTYDLSAEENKPFIDEARECFRYVIEKKDKDFGNARFARNLLHDAVSEQLLRLDEAYPQNEPIPEEEMRVLKPEDIPAAYRRAGGTARRCDSLSVLRAENMPVSVSRPILKEDIHQAVSSIQQSVVLLEILGEHGEIKGHGTGFLISQDGIIITCDHVVNEAEKIRARLFYPGMIGGERWFDDCEILQPSYSNIDMGLIKIKNARGFVPLILRPENEPIQTGEELILCGYPFGNELRGDHDPDFLPPSFLGTVAGTQKSGTDDELILMNGEGKSGNSGSPVISRTDGRVIGVFRGSRTHKSGDLVEEINYFTAIRLAWKYFIH